jgi:hypothetical protein
MEWPDREDQRNPADLLFGHNHPNPTIKVVSFYQIEIRSASWPQETDGGGAEPMRFRALQRQKD